MTFDDEHHRIALLGSPVPLERSRRPPIRHGITTSPYQQDPDGNFAELQIDKFATPHQATAYLNPAIRVDSRSTPERITHAHHQPRWPPRS